MRLISGESRDKTGNLRRVLQCEHCGHQQPWGGMKIDDVVCLKCRMTSDKE